MRVLFSILILSVTVSTFGQTNRINHFSHSGSLATINIFKANDNMGLGCGSVYKNEYSPSVDTTTVKWDSVQVDSNKVCTPNQPVKSIKALHPRQDTSHVYNRGPK